MGEPAPQAQTKGPGYRACKPRDLRNVGIYFVMCKPVFKLYSVSWVGRVSNIFDVSVLVFSGVPPVLLLVEDF